MCSLLTTLAGSIDMLTLARLLTGWPRGALPNVLSIGSGMPGQSPQRQCDGDLAGMRWWPFASVISC